MAPSDRRVSMDADGRYSSKELPPESPFAPLEPDDDHKMEDNNAPLTRPLFKFGTKDKAPESNFDPPNSLKRLAPTGYVWSHSGPLAEKGDGTDTPRIFKDVPGPVSGTAPPRIFNTLLGPSGEEIGIDLNAKYQIVCNQLEAQKAVVKARDQEIARLTTEVATTQTLWQESLKNANDENDELFKETKAQDEKIKEKDQDIQELIDDIDAKEKEIEDRDQEIVKYYDRIEEQGEELATLRKQKEELETREKAKDEEISRLKGQYKKLTDQWTSGKAAALKIIRERGEKIKEHEAKGQAKDHEISQLKAQCSDAAVQYDSMKKQAEEAVQERDNTIKEYEAREQAKDQEISQLKAQYSNGSNQYDTLKAEAENAVEERNKQIGELQAEIHAKDQEISQLQAQYSHASNQYESLKTAAEEEVSKRNKQIDEYKEKEQGRAAEIAQLRAECTKACEESKRFKAEYEAVCGQLDSAKAGTAGLEQLKDQEIAKLKAECSEASESYGTLKTEADETVRKRDKEIEDQKKELINTGTDIEQLRGELGTRDEEIAQLKAVLSGVSSDEHDPLRNQAAIQERDRTIEEQKKELSDKSISIEESWGREKAKKEEIIRLTNARNSLEETKDQEISQLAKQLNDATERLSSLQVNVQERNRKIENQEKELTDLSTAIEVHRGGVQAKDDEISGLKRRVQEAEGKGKVSASAESQLEKQIEDQDQTIKKNEQTINDLRKKLQDLKAQVKAHEMEKAEVKKLLETKETEDQGNLVKRIEQLTAMYEKKLSDAQKDFDRKRAEEVGAISKELAHLEEVKEGVQKDVDTLRSWVEKLAETSKDLRQEAEEEERHDNELDLFSPPSSPVRKIGRRASKPWRPWYSGSESEDDEEVRPRRRRTSSPHVEVPTNDSSTQTDDWSSTYEPLKRTAEMATQPEVDKYTETTEMATQTEGDKQVETAEKATQTVYIDTPSTPTSTITSRKISSWWRLLYWFLLLLAMAILIFALFYGESARRERMMWLKANDYTRRAVISVRGGGGRERRCQRGCGRSR